MESNVRTYIYMTMVAFCTIGYGASDFSDTYTESRKKESNDPAIQTEGPVQGVKNAAVDVAQKIGDQRAEVVEGVKDLYLEMKKIWLRFPKWARYSTYSGLATTFLIPILMTYTFNRLQRSPEFMGATQKFGQTLVASTIESAHEALANDQIMYPLYKEGYESLKGYIAHEANVAKKAAASRLLEHINYFWKGVNGNMPYFLIGE